MALWLYGFWTLTTAAWFWLALASLPETAPAWLAQTRQVCFGTLDNGLPDLHGWISLAAPLPMLLSLLVLMGADLSAQLRRLAAALAGRLLALLLVAAPFGILAFAGVQVARAPRLAVAVETGALPPDYPQALDDCPDFQLQDQDGQPVDARSLQGQLTLLTFAYAHCETVCPGMIENFRSAARQTGVRAVVVTLDPRRDTCGTLAGLGNHWKLPTGSLLLSGEVDQVEATLKAFGMTFERDEKTGDIAHPALVYVLDGRARIRYRFASPSQGWLVEACERLRREP